MNTTIQLVDVESAEGRKFLNKVIRENRKTRYGNGWKVSASQNSEWLIEFDITLEKGIGEPDECVSVRTNKIVRLPSDSKVGCKAQPFGDAEPVYVCRPKSFHLQSGDAKWAAKLLLLGANFEIVASSGSTSSSKHGLSFYHLDVSIPTEFGGYAVTLGGQTTAVNGVCVASGAVSI